MTLHIPFFTFAALALATVAGAQNEVHWTVTPAARTIVQGGRTTLTLSATIGKGWHLYSLTQGAGGPLPTQITLPKGQPFTVVGAITAPAPAVTFDSTLGIPLESYTHTVAFTIPIRVNKTAPVGLRKVHLTVSYQVCSANFCLPPRSDKLSATVQIRRAAATGNSEQRNETSSRRTEVVVPSVSGSVVGVTAFVNVGVVPMDRERVLQHQTVLVEGGRIVALGPTGHIHVPEGAMRIDGRERFLIPGLANMHAHLFLGAHVVNISMRGFSRYPLYIPGTDSAGAAAKLALWLANGVTTVRNMDYIDPKDWWDSSAAVGPEWGRQVLRLRASAATGTIWSPQIYTAGQWGPRQYIGFRKDGDSTPRLASVADYVAAYKSAGYDFIKIHSENDPQVLDSVLVAAKRLGIPVAGHIPFVTVEHILPFYRSIEHPLTDYEWHHPGHDAAHVSEHDTSGIGVLAAAMRHDNVWHCPTQGHYDRWHAHAPSVLKVEQDSGVKLLLGTDEFPWLGGITQELQAMVRAGLTPYQALLTGTRNVAEYFGTLNQSGTIVVGKRADMVLLTGNPLQDVRYTAQPAGVMIGGRWLPREELTQRVASLTLPTFILGVGVQRQAPVKSYWQNVADELEETTLAPLGDIYDTQLFDRLGIRSLQTVHQAQLAALVDSLGTSDHYVAATQRLLHLISQQLGEDRQMLSPEHRPQQ